MVNKAFTAVYKRTGRWFSAWIEEIPGVNTQGRTRQEAQDNLREALLMILAVNRELSRKQGRGNTFRELLQVRVPA